MSIWELVLRLLLSFLTLLVLTRWIGRKLISHMTFFDFVSGITFGSIGANLVINSKVGIMTGVLALIGWGIITIVLGYIDIHSNRARILLDGEPRILVKKGDIMEKQLKEVRLDVDSLMALLREKDIFSIQDVDYAIFETNGNLSVLKKDKQKSVTRSDLNLKTESRAFPPVGTELISDGKLMYANLEKLNLSEAWVLQQLKHKGIHSVEEVFYGEVNKNGNLVVDVRREMD
jgi:uncharacterized membrane protein YcaP (DUF421 family)